MFPSYDMNPIAIDKMLQERLDADVDDVTRQTGNRLPIGGAIALILMVLVAVI